MKRHVIAGKYGPKDTIEIPLSTNEQLTRLELVSGEKSLNYGIHAALSDLKAQGITPSEVGLDLLVVAAHVHAADTRISRQSESQDSWTREIRLVVPVKKPELWRSACSTLTTILNFLTGDRWTIGFRKRPVGFSPDKSSESLLPVSFNEVSLFSGGMDSLIGTINLLENGRAPLLISHASEGATSQAQNSLFESLKKKYSTATIERLRVWMNFPNDLVKGINSEDTTRGRSFLFFSLGIFAGTGLGTSFVLRVPENGLIALNVPLDPLRLGSNSTRTTHPYYMARWNDLLNELSINGSVENPFWNKTKGEMAKECQNTVLLKKLIPESLSCSSPAKARWLGEGHGIEHCGYCLPCLIRRAAMNSAFGSTNDFTNYTIQDLRSHTLDTKKSEGKQVRSFQVASNRLRKQPVLAKTLIHKPGPLTDETMRLEQWANVYQRGLEEVAKFIYGVTTKPN